MDREFTNISSDLLWQCTRNANRYLVRRKDIGVSLSSDPFNLTNLNKARYSGIANTKAIGLKASRSKQNVIELQTKVASKTNRPAKNVVTYEIKPGKNARKLQLSAAKIACMQVGRRDLRRAAMARASALARARAY